MIIGISGLKQSGKDKFTEFFLEEIQNYNKTGTRRALADDLKEEIADFLLDRIQQDNKNHIYTPCFINVNNKQSIINIMNTTGEKEKFRLLMQWWGTEFRRNMVCSNYWIVKLENWIQNCAKEVDFVLIPDIRFLNEIEWIKKEGGCIINIKRSADSKKDKHSSETSLDDFEGYDFVVNNDGSLEELKKQTKEITQKIINNIDLQYY